MMTNPRRDRPETSLDADLADLHEVHVWHVNAALSAGREELARQVAHEYPDAALQLLVRSPG